jgi:hypothetical protein
MQQFIRVIGIPSGAVSGPNASVVTVIATASNDGPTTTVQFEFGGLLDLGEVITSVMTVTLAAEFLLLSADDSPLSVVQVSLPASPRTGMALCIVATNYNRLLTILGTIGNVVLTSDGGSMILTDDGGTNILTAG